MKEKERERGIERKESRGKWGRGGRGEGGETHRESTGGDRRRAEESEGEVKEKGEESKGDRKESKVRERWAEKEKESTETHTEMKLFKRVIINILAWVLVHIQPGTTLDLVIHKGYNWMTGIWSIFNNTKTMLNIQSGYPSSQISFITLSLSNWLPRSPPLTIQRSIKSKTINIIPHSNDKKIQSTLVNILVFCIIILMETCSSCSPTQVPWAHSSWGPQKSSMVAAALDILASSKYLWPSNWHWDKQHFIQEMSLTVLISIQRRKNKREKQRLRDRERARQTIWIKSIVFCLVLIHRCSEKRCCSNHFSPLVEVVWYICNSQHKILSHIFIHKITIHGIF